MKYVNRNAIKLQKNVTKILNNEIIQQNVNSNSIHTHGRGPSLRSKKCNVIDDVAGRLASY